MTFRNKVSWDIEPERCALLIHDMQPHYLGALPADARAELLDNVREIGIACASRDIPTFASQVPTTRTRRERGLMFDMWGSGPPSNQCVLDPAIGLAEQDVRLLIKRSYSAFYGNELEVMLRRLGRDSIIIVGVYTSIGCYLSAADAFMRDIRAFIVEDATADMDEADHKHGLVAAARTCACVIDTDRVTRSILSKISAPHRNLNGIDVC